MIDLARLSLTSRAMKQGKREIERDLTAEIRLQTDVAAAAKAATATAAAATAAAAVGASKLKRGARKADDE